MLEDMIVEIDGHNYLMRHAAKAHIENLRAENARLRAALERAILLIDAFNEGQAYTVLCEALQKR